MKTTFVLLAALLAAPGAFAQSPTAPSYAVAPAPAAPRHSAGGSVTYFGTVYSHDAQHEQFARLRQAFEACQPTVVFFENYDNGTDSTEAAAIGRTGAAGYARFLARQHGMPAERLDNSLAEYAYLQTRIDPERLKLFCLLRQTQRFRASTGAAKGLTKKALRAYLAHSASFLPGTERCLHNLAEFEAAYRKYCPAGTNWWQAPGEWFSPNAAAARTTNAFFQDVNGAVGAFREQYMYRRLAGLAQAGQRVLVVADRDLLPAQGPALARN